MDDTRGPRKKPRLRSYQPTVESDDGSETEQSKNESDRMIPTTSGEHQEHTTTTPDAAHVAAGIAKLAVRDNRRKGIYGAQDLGSVEEVARASGSTLRPHNSSLSGFSNTAVKVAKSEEQNLAGVTRPPSATTAGDVSSSFHTQQPQAALALRPVVSTMSESTSRRVTRVHPSTGGLRVPGYIPDKIGAPYLDADRDQHGNLLPQVDQPFLMTYKTIHSSSEKDSTKIRGRQIIGSASAVTQHNIKRKRTADILPPPAFVYQRTGDPNFNIFYGMLLYPELCFLLAKQLQSRDLISLYAISKDFHTIIDTRFTTVCLDQVTAKAPESAKIFHFRSYKQYCRPDPAARIPHPDPRRRAEGTPRYIPSFKWVQFVIYREKVVHEICAIFAENGCPLPRRCALALKRIWYIMDVPNNAIRIGAIHNHKIFTNLDLYFSMAFFVKLDMILNDPLATEKQDGVRKLLLSAPDGFTTLHRVLTRQKWRTRTDVITAWIRNCLELPGITHHPEADPEAMGTKDVLGVPARECGVQKYEYWGRKGLTRTTRDGRKVRADFLLRPDQLVMREAVRRGLRFHKHILRSMLYGYVRPDTLEDYPPQNWPRRIPEYNDEEYIINDPVGAPRALSIGEGGDPLLDLGDAGKGSRYTHVQEGPDQLSLKIKEAHESFLDLFGWWKTEEEPKLHGDDLTEINELRWM